MRLALAQIDPTVGDLHGNVALVAGAYEDAVAAGADLVAFPELVVSGYPPEDLLLKDHFLEDCQAALWHAAAGIHEVPAVLGVPLSDGESGAVNAAAVVWRGRVHAVYRKIWLPNYAVFDEERYFTPGDTVLILDAPYARVGFNICEDIWRSCGPTEEAALLAGADLIVNISMSPYHQGKGREREDMLRRRAVEAGAFIAYVNGVGGQDELVFDGHSVVVAPDGSLLARGRQFAEQLLLVDVDTAAARRVQGSGRAPGLWAITVTPLGEANTGEAIPNGSEVRVATEETAATAPEAPAVAPTLSREAEVYEALTLGVRDYVDKNGFSRAVIGLSGGIDSALTACIAADALGRERVTGVTMPSRYSSTGTRDDAHLLAERLEIDLLELSIEEVFGAYLETLGPVFAGRPPDSAEENVQARIRGNLLMALSNKFGWLVLTTGNKSEMAVGYATLYGDMAGGFAVIKDVPKTLVYELAAYRNSRGAGDGPIPASTISRAPSAELRPDQADQDTLPPYALLDAVIEGYVVRDDSVDELVSQGLDREMVEHVVAMIDSNEYKRRQAAPGVRITPKAFGKDRRLPITNRYRG